MELYTLSRMGLCRSCVAHPTASPCFSDPYDIESHALLTLAESVWEVSSTAASRYVSKLETLTTRSERWGVLSISQPINMTAIHISEYSQF